MDAQLDALLEYLMTETTTSSPSSQSFEVEINPIIVKVKAVTRATAADYVEAHTLATKMRDRLAEIMGSAPSIVYTLGATTDGDSIDRNARGTQLRGHVHLVFQHTPLDGDAD